MVVTVPNRFPKQWRHRRGSRFDSGSHPLLRLARGTSAALTAMSSPLWAEHMTTCILHRVPPTHHGEGAWPIVQRQETYVRQ